MGLKLGKMGKLEWGHSPLLWIAQKLEEYTGAPNWAFCLNHSGWNKDLDERFNWDKVQDGFYGIYCLLSAVQGLGTKKGFSVDGINKIGLIKVYSGRFQIVRVDG